MAYNHGVTTQETPTSLVTPVEVSAGVSFIVGTAPINMTDPSNVNKPVMCNSYDEFVAAFGYVPAKADSASGLNKFEYTLSEFAQAAFSLFSVKPVIAVNVLDPTKHKKTADTTSVTLDAKTGSATIAETGIILSSISLAQSSGGAYTAGTDFIASFDSDGNLVITSLSDDDGFKCATAEALTFSADKLDPSKVTEDEIIGGVDVSGNKSGFELVHDCFPRFRLTPGILLAPGFSHSASVAAVMATKCTSINTLFKAVCVVDVPTESVKSYTNVAEWKNTNNVVDPNQIVCWPLIAMDGTVYHLSTQAAVLMADTDANNGAIPYVSPSNKNLQMTATVLADGTEVTIGPDNGAYLNSQGIVTAINFIGGWKFWGSQTACYPGNTDVKDSIIPIRRMFGWVANTLIQTFWQRVDAPLNRRQIDTVLDSVNIWLNGLVSSGVLLGGYVEFRQEDNTTLDLMDGIAKFKVHLTPPSPNREIIFDLEYDPDALEALFA